MFDSMESCCSLGKDWADTAGSCDGITVPVADVIPELQTPCISSMELCCSKARSEAQCAEGKAAALGALECGGGEDEANGQVYKDCCLACTLGILVASMAGKCDGLNPVFDCHQQEPFDSCCVEFLELPMANMTEASGDQPDASTDPEASIDLSEGEMQDQPSGSGDGEGGHIMMVLVSTFHFSFDKTRPAVQYNQEVGRTRRVTTNALKVLSTTLS